jgi:hypothetical protein
MCSLEFQALHLHSALSWMPAKICQLLVQVEVAHCDGSAGEAVCRRAQDVHAEAVVMAR